MDLYLPGAKIIKGSDSGPMLGGPRKVVWHTTENDPATTTAANVAAYLQRSGNTAHLVWNPVTGEIVQMIPANLGAKALENKAGGVQTNRGGTYVIQIEVVGRASKPFTSGPCVGLPKIQAWLASLGIPAVWSGTPDRSTANWAKSGHFGHADVPENSHWDPGAIDKTKLTDTEETDMPLTIADADLIVRRLLGTEVTAGLVVKTALHRASEAPAAVDIAALAAAIVAAGGTGVTAAQIAKAVNDDAARRLVS